MKIVWKDIPNYDGLYQVSNTGLVKSMNKYIKSKMGSLALRKEKNLSPKTDKDGYLSVTLTKNGNRKCYRIHRLVLLAFLGESKLQVDHINGIKDDNNLINLRYCTLRENNTYFREKKKSSSKYVGVSWGKKENKWRAQAQVNKVQYHLGFYDCEKQARKAYLNFIEQLNEKA